MSMRPACGSVTVASRTVPLILRNAVRIGPLHSRAPSWQGASTTPAATSSGRIVVTLFPGDGIGPEIAEAVEKVFDAARVPIDFERYAVGTPEALAKGKPIPDAAAESVRRNRVALKGPLATPIGKGHPSLNLALRKMFDLYANVRPCRTVEGVRTQYENVDLMLIRENTEGEYSGLEHEVVPGVVESLKLITRSASERIARYAFETARALGRPQVVAVHKVDVMRLSDGLFLDCCRRAAQEYRDIQYRESFIDNACLRLVRDPQQFSSTVMVMPNLYGDILSDLGAGLIGGLGLTPSANFGRDVAIFEAVHGTAPDIAGQNKANPTALLLSALMMLRHLGLQEAAARIDRAVRTTLREGKTVTRDLGGTASTQQYVDAVIAHLRD